VTSTALWVAQRSDLLFLAGEPGRADGFHLLFTDPGLLDEGASLGLRGELRRLPAGRDFHARAMTQAITRATALDAALTAERDKLWPGRTLQGWDFGVFYLALLRLSVAQQLGALVEQTFPETRIGLLRPSKPQQMYFDSFVVTDLHLARDPARFVVAGSYDTVRWQREGAYTLVSDGAAIAACMAGGRISAVTHVPTCFYDRPWIVDEVARVHGWTIDLPSPLWDVPVHRGAPMQRPLAEVAGSPTLQRWHAAATRVLDAQFADLLPLPGPRAQQVQAWAERCVWQAANYEALAAGLHGTRPQFLLSDQDTGLNGPLFSVADELGAPVTVIPHSGHSSMRVPHPRRVSVVEKAGYGSRPLTLYGQPVATRPVRFNTRTARQPHPKLRALCLMLNSLNTEGLSYVDVYALAAFFQPLAALCNAADVQLVLRPKPGGPALSLLCSALGLPAEELIRHTTEPLEALAERCALVVAYGEPTTGVAPFLDGGSLVVQVHEQHWPADLLACMPLVADGVIPLLDNAGALAFVQQLLADPVLFQQRRAAQNAAFDARAAGAHAHLFDDRAPGIE
jgi:hypothetical protein